MPKQKDTSKKNAARKPAGKRIVADDFPDYDEKVDELVPIQEALANHPIEPSSETIANQLTKLVELVSHRKRKKPSTNKADAEPAVFIRFEHLSLTSKLDRFDDLAGQIIRNAEVRKALACCDEPDGICLQDAGKLFVGEYYLAGEVDRSVLLDARTWLVQNHLASVIGNTELNLIPHHAAGHLPYSMLTPYPASSYKEMQAFRIWKRYLDQGVDVDAALLHKIAQAEGKDEKWWAHHGAGPRQYQRYVSDFRDFFKLNQRS